MNRFSADKHYHPVTPYIASEIVDGEAVIMDMRTGHYYSTSGSGAAIWEGLCLGLNATQICDRLNQCFKAMPPDSQTHINFFVETLYEKGLIHEQPTGGSDEAQVHKPAPVSVFGAFETPILEEYTDMSELLLLDPVHDVAEVGWPVQRNDVNK